jgi:hypothetical protein
MRSLHSFVTEYDLPKTSVRRWLNANGFNTSEGLDDAAEQAAFAEFVTARKMPEVHIVNERECGLTIDSYSTELTFNPASLVGMTNGTEGAIEALRQVSGVAAALRKGVEQVGAKAQEDYLRVSDAARDVLSELEDLQHTITQVKAQSSVLEAMKLDRLNDGLAAKNKVDELRGQPK